MCLQFRVAVKIEKPLKGKLKVSQLKNEYKVLTQLNKNGKLVVESLPSSHPQSCPLTVPSSGARRAQGAALRPLRRPALPRHGGARTQPRGSHAGKYLQGR